MKVHLVVVSGKNEGRSIPLVGPMFKIGRGETCHLRPNSERVSREHAEFSVFADKVVVRDLSSRNGTLVNGKLITAPCTLRDRDLVQVGPLIFSVAILDAPRAEQPSIVSMPPLPDPGASDSWQIADITDLTAVGTENSGRDTIMIPAFTEAMVKASVEHLSDDELDEQYERQGEGSPRDSAIRKSLDAARNKAAQTAPASTAATSEATAAILRRMMARPKKTH